MNTRDIIKNKFRILIESRATEQMGLSMLSKSGVSDGEGIIKQFAAGDKSKNQKNIPLMAYLYIKGEKNIKNLIDISNSYNELEVKGKAKPYQFINKVLKVGEKEFGDFIKFSEYIHGLESLHAKKGESTNVASDFVANKKPMWSGNGIDIYEGNNVGKCIAYTQGGLTGKAYSFCIGQPGNTMYKSYRDSKESSFYFIIDRNHFKENEDGSVNLDDPLHIVVFDNTKYGVELTDANNTTGTISEYGNDVNGYVDYLKSKGVPVDRLIKRSKTGQEEYEDKLLGNENDSLDWFINLDNPRNPDYKKPELESGESEQNYYKSAYIGRGHLLTNDQFDYILGER